MNTSVPIFFPPDNVQEQTTKENGAIIRRVRDGLELDQSRWQIELAVERLKRLFHPGEVPTKDTPITRSFLYAAFLAANILEDMTAEFFCFSPLGHRLVGT